MRPSDCSLSSLTHLESEQEAGQETLTTTRSMANEEVMGELRRIGETLQEFKEDRNKN